MTLQRTVYAGRVFDRFSALLRSWPTQLDRERGILQGFAEVASALRVGRGSKRSFQTRLVTPEKRLLLEQLRLNEEIERMVAADRARRERRRQKRRRAWIERYGPF
jgi:hypothetical protein